MNIEKIDIRFDSDVVTFKVTHESGDKEDIKFAYYLHKDGDRIHVEWYNDSPEFSFKTNGEPGYYRATCFIRASDGTAVMKTSRPVFLNPDIVTDGDVQGKDLKSAFVFMSDNWEVPMLYYPSTENKLFVLTPSAVDRVTHQLPIFTRFTWAAQGLFPGKVLCISDPTLALHDQLELGWCLGSASSDLTGDIARFITDYARSVGIPNKNIVIWGSSAGGFSALSIAARIENSTAVAINPQIEPLRFFNTKQVDLVKSIVFPKISDEEIQIQYKERINALELKNNGRKFKSVLIQNILDTHHFDVHSKPYWEGIGGQVAEGWSESGGDLAYFYSDPRGHIAEPESMIPEIVAKCFPSA
ncbi:hypothetical protein [Burkholderia sp. BCC1998]|uniref:hypothetical protein n=1 Tax=Burkholderia sp. BCC1998 TaxID=2817447 RepID=UPI002AB6F222|nr:hypothetical protein [Burkholderia sp. BCC1998]